MRRSIIANRSNAVTGMGAQLARALGLLAFLGSTHTFTIDQLAEQLECSRRHAYRMIQVVIAYELAHQIGPNLWQSTPQNILCERRRHGRARAA